MKHLRKQKNPGLPTSNQSDAERKEKYRRRRSDRQTNLRRSEEIMIQRKDETPGDSTDTGAPPKENDSSDEAGDFSGDKATKRQTREETRSQQTEWEGVLTCETQNNTCVEMGSRQAEESSENVGTDCTREHQCGKDKDMENQHEEASSENGTHESTGHNEERSETVYRHEGVGLLARKPSKQHGTLLYETERLAELSWKREMKDFQSSAREDEKTEGGLDDSETLAENHEGAQKRKKRESRREPHRKNLRKSTSPNHFADYRRTEKAAPWFSHKEFMEDMEEFINEELEKTTREDAKAVVGEDDDLLKFAEILYKCSLCTALPCILTSQSAFLSHVREHHLTVRAPGVQCQLCDLHFHTNTDLQTHLSDSHHQALQENLHTSSVASDEAHDDQELAELENGENSVRSISADYKTEKELSGQSANVDSGWGDRKSFGQTASDTGDKQQTDYCEAGSKSTDSSTARVMLDTKRPPRSPLATVQYRSSRHLSQLQMLADQAMPQPLTPHQQATDKARSPMFSSGGGVPEGINGFPSFTPEFGRFTKLIREGGKIVYFCQVCNVKCQVKAAFQVHCNGLRHHNKVNLAAKNKTHRVSPDSPRDVGLRTPLREVSVTGPQVTSSKGDPAFVEKMTKFFQDHPDVSAMVHRNRAVSSSSSSSSSNSSFICPPVSFSFADRFTEDSDSRLGSRLSRTCATSPDKDLHGDRQRYTENSGVSFSPEKEFQSQNQPPSVSRDSGEDADKETSCWGGTGWRSDPKKSGEWITGQDKDDDVHAERLPHAGSRKRAASVATRGDPPTLPDSDSPSQTRPSSTSSVNSSGNVLPLSRHGESERCDFGVSGCGGGSGQEPSESKRAKLDATYSRCHQSGTQDFSDKQLSETAGFHKEFSRTTSAGGFFMTKSQTNLPAGCSDAAETAGSRLTDRERGKCAHVDECPDVKMTRDSTHDLTSTESRNPSGRDTGVSTAEEKPATANMNTSDSTDPHAGCFLSEQALASVDEETNRRPSPVYDATGSRLDSGLLGEDWLSRHDARAVKEELGLWSGAGGGVPDLEDVAMDTSKGQNNEGWKVAKIRDVLRGMLASSNKGSNVSRDVLLHRVSVALQEADVLQWGPACNRAVRELFPHSLAQRKGKFKKTYFFGLSLLPGLEEARVDDPVDCLSYRPLRDMTQDLEQLLEHLPGVLLWSGQVERGVTRDDVLHVLAARLSESEVYQWGMQCNKALRILFPLVLMKRKGKYKTTVYFGVDFTHAAQRLIPTIGATLGQIPWQE